MRGTAATSKPKSYSYQHNMGTGNGFDVAWFLKNNQGRCQAWTDVLRVFAGSHGVATDQQIFPAMMYRYEDNAGNVEYISRTEALARAAGHWRKRPDPTAIPPFAGTPASNGDVIYEPAGIWVEADGQANPFYPNAPHLVSFFIAQPTCTDHVFVKYDGKYYDPSYEHSNTGYPSVNGMIDSAKISFYYYGGQISAAARALLKLENEKVVSLPCR